VDSRSRPVGPRGYRRLLSFRFVRFLASSGVSVVVGTIVLVGGYSWLGWPAALASIASFFSAALVSYVLYRGWTFARRGRPSLTRDVVPYSAVVLLSLLVSTGAAQIGAMVGQRMSHERTIQSLAVLGAVIIANVVFVPVRYVICRWIFSDQAGESDRNPGAVTVATTGPGPLAAESVT
jgi:putative flippase GtrA